MSTVGGKPVLAICTSSLGQSVSYGADALDGLVADDAVGLLGVEKISDLGVAWDADDFACSVDIKAAKRRPSPDDDDDDEEYDDDDDDFDDDDDLDEDDDEDDEDDEDDFSEESLGDDYDDDDLDEDDVYYEDDDTE